MIPPLIIAEERADGTVRAIRLTGRGSTIAAAGRLLDACYTTPAQVSALIQRGDLVALGASPVECALAFEGEAAATYASAEALRRELRGVHAALLYRGGQWHTAVSVGAGLQEWQPLGWALDRLPRAA